MCDTKAKIDEKVVLITGGSSGMGFEAAKNLAKSGARVIISSRNKTKLLKAKEEIVKATGNNNVAYRQLDLGSLKSVRDFAAETLSVENRLDVLINNAGAVGLPDRLTEDGLNLTMQVNYFGAFLLTYLLMPLLKSSAPSRIITGTAASMYIGTLDFDHINDIGRYNIITSLANSKLADALLSAELSRRLDGTGVTSNSFDPFVVGETDLLNNIPELYKDISKLFVNMIGQRKEEVGKQIAYLAAAPEMEGVSGNHYKFCRPWIKHWLMYDEDLTKNLWEESKRLVKITEEEDWELS